MKLTRFFASVDAAVNFKASGIGMIRRVDRSLSPRSSPSFSSISRLSPLEIKKKELERIVRWKDAR